MANETVLSLISTLLDPIREAAVFYAKQRFVGPQLTMNFTNGKGMLTRTGSIYRESAAVSDNLAELDDLTPSQVDREWLRDLTPKEIGKQVVVSDRRIMTDDENILFAIRDAIGYAIGQKVERDIFAQFANLAGGSMGTAGSSFSMDSVIEARTELQRWGIPGPYVAVLHPYQWLDVYKTYTALSNPAPLDIRNEIQRDYFIRELNGIVFVVSPFVPYTGTTNEVQTATVSGTPTGGTFKLSFRGAETASIAYNAAAATVQSALEALRTIGTGNVTVSGSAGGPYTITFVGSLAGANLPLLVLSTNALTGGTTPSVGIVQTTAGVGYATGAMLAPGAIALDLRKPLGIEPQRDASRRLTEFNATMIYGVGVWRPEHGIKLVSDATAPNA